MLPAAEQARDLGHRRDHARGEHGGGDERAGGDVAGDHHGRADEDHRGIDAILHALRPGGEAGGEAAQAKLGLAGDTVVVIPLALEALLRLQRLDVLYPLHRLDQQRVAQRAFPHRFGGEDAQAPLREQAGHEQQYHRGEGHQRQHPADKGEDGEEEQEEGQVGHRGDGGRGQHVADLVEVAQLGDEGAGGSRPFPVADAQRMAEDQIGEPQIGPLAQHVGDRHAQLAQQEVEGDRQQHAEEQDDERRHRLGRNDAVIDLHREQDAGEPEQVGHDRGDRDMAIGAGVLEQDAAKPMLLIGPDIGVDPGIGGGAGGAGHDDQSGGGEQFGERTARGHVALAGDGEHRLAVAVQRGDQGKLAIGEAGDHRQAPTRQPYGGGVGEAKSQAQGASERAHAILLGGSDVPEPRQASALLGDGQAIVARGLAENVEPGLGRCRAHSVTPRRRVPVRPNASRERPE